jgi:penicillin-binding protein 2D
MGLPFRRRRNLYQSPRRRSVTVSLAGVLLLLVGLLASVGTVLGRAQTLKLAPGPRSFAADSLMYDRAGRLIADLHPAGATRIPVALAAVAQDEQRAIVAVEDRNFWHEGSADWGRLAGAAVYDATHRDRAQGASTITEQLARLLYLSNDKTYERKLREMALAQAMDSRMSKQQILGEYLNDVYFGHGATGIEAAAHVYFGVPAAKLDLAQSALLAGLPNAPSALDPLSNPGGARDRQRVVLDAMVRMEAITAAQADAAFQERLTFGNGGADDLNLHPKFARQVAQLVGERLRQDPNTAGLTIRTSLDPGLQQAAENAVRRQVSTLAGRHVSDGAVVSLDPQTGEILAYVGDAGSNHPGSQLDMAAQTRQPGSTMKVVTYSEAIAEKKVTMLTPVSDAPLSLRTGGGTDGNQPWVVNDYDNRNHGVVPVAVALGSSLNIPSVRVEQQVGVASVLGLARKLGIGSLSRPTASYGPSLTLGSYPVPLRELAQAYGAIADGGTPQSSRFVLSVRGPDGQELWASARANPTGGRVLDPGVAFIMSQILSNDSNRAMTFGRGSDLVIRGHTVAAKTGTTSDNRDALTVGWTPHLLTAAWVGNADNSAMDNVAGALGAAPIWHSVMAAGLASSADGWPAPPANVHAAWANGQPGWFLEGTGPNTPTAPGLLSPGTAGGTQGRR